MIISASDSVPFFFQQRYLVGGSEMNNGRANNGKLSESFAGYFPGFESVSERAVAITGFFFFF